MTPHPGALVREIIAANNSTVSEVARAIDMDRASLTLVTQGRYRVTRDLAWKLDHFFGPPTGDTIIAAIRAYEDAHKEHDRAKFSRIVPKGGGPAALPTAPPENDLSPDDMLTRLACISALFGEGEEVACERLALIHRIVAHPEIDSPSAEYLLDDTHYTDVERIESMFPHTEGHRHEQ